MIYVVLGSLGSLLGVLLALRQLLSAMRRRWLQDDEHARAVRANTEAVRDLAATITTMTSRLDDHEKRLRAGNL